MLDGEQTFSDAFTSDPRQLGMMLANLIEDLSIEPIVERENIGWGENDLNAFFDNERAPSKASFAEFVALLQRRGDGGSKGDKLLSFWSEHGDDGDDVTFSEELQDVPDEEPERPPSEQAVAPTTQDVGGAAESEQSTKPKEPTPADIGRNIRAAVRKAKRKLLETLNEAGVETDKMFIAQYEKGNRELTEEQLSRIAELCEVTKDQLLTGEGLENFFPKEKRRQASLVSVKQSIELPPISAQRIEEFFRSRVLSRTVKPAEGVEVGQLMELVAKVMQGEEIDWVQAWSEYSEEGQKFQISIDKKVKSLQDLGEIPKIIFLQRMVAALFPPEDAS